MEKPTSLNKTGLNKFFWPLIIFSGLLITFFTTAIIYFGFITKITDKDFSATPQIIGKIKSADDVPSATNGQSVFTRTGTVVALKGKALYFESVYSQGDKIMKTVLKAMINPETAIIKRDVSELLKLGPQATETTGITPVNIKEIQVGDTVTVFSADNIKDKIEFPAVKVEKRYSS